MYCNVTETDDDDRYVNDDDDGIFLMLLFFLHFICLNFASFFYSLPCCLALPFSTLPFMVRVQRSNASKDCLVCLIGVVRWCEGVMYLTSPGHPTDIGLQLHEACYPCSR